MFDIPLRHFQGFKKYTTRDYVIAVSEETDLVCTGAPHNAFMIDATRAVVDEEENNTSGEQHPMAVSTLQVFEDADKPDYCTRGTRFGPHSCNEVFAHVPSTFYAPDFGKLTSSRGSTAVPGHSTFATRITRRTWRITSPR